VTWQKEWRETKPGELCHRFRTVRRELRDATPTIQATLEEAERAAEAQRQRWIAESLEREKRELERRRAEAGRASREELLAIVERWALARRMEDFFGDADARATRLDDEERNRVMTRLEVARELLGGTDALRQFAGWRSPVERESMP
jgi:GTP1/Obg family GTP-binding protein